MAENYPIGIQHFTKLRENGGIYVDNTPLIYLMLEKETNATYFFLRPRRFGKSLLLSTLKCIFEGRKELFKGLWIEDKLDWETHPVIHLSMTELAIEDLGLKTALDLRIRRMADEMGVSLPEVSDRSPLSGLIQALHKKHGRRVVILIDEYDRPITMGLEAGNADLAVQNRDLLKAFYAGLKDADDQIRFLFITGISKFAKVSIFSELNHLKDLTLDARFATLCGYTQQELEAYFPEGITNLARQNGLTRDETLQKVRDWYNGFSWDAQNFVYNPFSTLLLLDSGQFENYWFQTGTPTFLVKLLNGRFDYCIEGRKTGLSAFELFDLRRLDPFSLLLQTGYLTLKKRLEEGYYLTGFPNREVRNSFNEMLLGDYLDKQPWETGAQIYELAHAFRQDDLPQVMGIMQALFAAVPYTLYERKDPQTGEVKAVGENFFHAVIYLIFNLLGVKMQAEVSVAGGRIDATVETAAHVYIFEFKRDNQVEEALQQMREKGYTDKYTASGKSLHLVAVSFSVEKRGIGEWREEVVTPS